MADILSKKRSQIMLKVRSKDTEPEFKMLHNKGYRFRLHRNDLPVKLDIIMQNMV